MVDSATRAYPRYAVEADIEVRVLGTTARGRTANVSRGGLCVELDLALAPGTDLEVAIELVFDDQGRSEPLVLTARSMWSTKIDARFQVGCCFTGLGQRHLAYLDMFLRYLEGAKDGDPGTSPGDDPFA